MERLRSVLLDYKPDVVGFSLRNADTTSHSDPFSYIPAALRQIDSARKVLPGAFIVAGGAGFSIFAREIMAVSPAINCGIEGHGELIAPEIMNSRVNGFFQGGSGGFTRPRFDLLSVSSYVPFERNLSVGVEVNRGCGKCCAYCSYPALSGNRVLEKPALEIKREIGQLITGGCRHFCLIAPVLNNRRKRGEEVAMAVRSLNSSVTWEAYHSAVDFDGDYASLIFDSGCRAVSFSPDGGTAEQMKRMGKDYTPAELESAILAASEKGIKLSLNLFPWDGRGTTAEMFQAFRNGSRWGKLAGNNLRRLRFSLIRRLPCTIYAPAAVSVSEKVAGIEFVKPAALGMIVYMTLKKLCEIDRIR